MIVNAGIPATKIFKLQQGRPNVLDAITNNEVDLVINTPDDKKGAMDDSYIRKGVIKSRIPYVTTMAAAKASAQGIKTMQEKTSGVKSLHKFHAEIG
jgi:carbamoyl-phosphate synthase large subunit